MQDANKTRQSIYVGLSTFITFTYLGCFLYFIFLSFAIKKVIVHEDVLFILFSFFLAFMSFPVTAIIFGDENKIDVSSFIIPLCFWYGAISCSFVASVEIIKVLLFLFALYSFWCSWFFIKIKRFSLQLFRKYINNFVQHLDFFILLKSEISSRVEQRQDVAICTRLAPEYLTKCNDNLRSFISQLIKKKPVESNATKIRRKSLMHKEQQLTLFV